MRVATYVYLCQQTCANRRLPSRWELRVPLGQPRIKVGTADQHERSRSGGHALVFRPLPLANQAGEIDPL